MGLHSGDKHHLRKSLDRNAQIRRRSFRSPDWFGLCFSIWSFSQLVFILQAKPHAKSLLLFPIGFGINDLMCNGTISSARWNFQRRPILCTTLYRNLMQASNLGGTFDQLFLWIFFMKFSQKMPLYVVYTMYKKSKMTKTSNERGGGVPP